MIADTREHTRSGGRVGRGMRSVPFTNTTYVVTPLGGHSRQTYL